MTALDDLRRRVEALEALEQQRAATEPAQEWIERRIYKNSIEYSEYIKQRFQDRTSLSFVFDGHRWQYRYSSFDDAGDYDLIFRPSVPKPAPERRAATEESSATDVDSALLRTGMVTANHILVTIREALPPEPAPAPAADRPLWEVMVQAWNDSGTFDFSAAHRYAAEIDAVASWLEQRYLDRFPGAAELLRAEARRTREGA